MKKIFKNFGFTRYIRAVLAVLSASVMLLGIQAGAYAQDHSVSNEQMLKDAIINSSQGDTIIFINDITLTDNLPPFSFANGIIINGNGYTLNGNGHSILEFEQGITPGNISDLTFENGSNGGGGAIYVRRDLSGTTSDSTFSGNKVTSYGGAIQAGTLSGTISNSIFSDNEATNGDGGAIWVDNDLSGTILNSTFEGNKAGGGGAIYARTLSGTISNSIFSDNKVTNYGGAIHAVTLSGTISNSIFSDNEATNGEGGAIYADTLSGTISNSIFSDNEAHGRGGAIYAPRLSGTISNSIFTGNEVTLNGGAIYAYTLSGNISNSTFSGNKAASGGGIYVWDELSGTISNSIFSDNKVTNYGGAIHAVTLSGTISNSIFSDNEAHGSGGAIWANRLSGIIEDTSFINNSTDTFGGAIWTGEGSNFTIAAINKDVVFSGNKAGITGNDIYLEGSAAQQTVLNLNTNPGRWIYFNGGIATTDDVTITQDGNVYFDAPVDFQGNLNTAYNFTNGILKLGKESYLDGANFHLGAIGGGTDGNCLIDLRNGAFGTMNPVSLTLAGDTNLVLGIDADLIKGKTDTFSAGSFNNNGNSLNIAFVSNIINDREGTTIIPLGNVLLNPDIISGTSFSDTTAMGRILKYNVSADAEGDALTYTQTGFNPAILASPVAATAGTLAIQMNTFREAFNNMDRLMNMSRNARFALKNQNRTAISEATTDAPFRLYTSRDEGSTWYRPHISIEKVNLKGAKGSSVNNTTYGAYFGGDMQMKELKNGWDVVHSAYGGYTGAHQTFEGIGNYQNGAALGVASTFYKNDFFMGLTANVGYMNNHASTMYGKDNFNTINSGIAAKFGNNFEYKRLIMQPSMLLGYTFVNTFDYTTASDVRVKSNPLHAIILQPGIKLIANTESGWQPYFGANVVWNIMGQSKVRANNIYLPELSVKPYAQYGVGIQKIWNDRFSCFVQAMVRSGGRTGIDFSAGLNIAVGKDYKKDAL